MGFSLADLRAAVAALSTPRLRFERPDPSQAQALAGLINDSLPALRFIHWTHVPVDAAWAVQFLERSAALDARGEALVVHAFERTSGHLVALYDLHTLRHDVPRCQIGYVGHRGVSGQGLVREGALALIDAAFVGGMWRVEAWCDARNERSVRFSESLGLRREGLMRQVSRDPQGERCDEWLLARLASDPPPA